MRRGWLVACACLLGVFAAALVTSLGLRPEAVARLMREIGFRPNEAEPGWLWRGRERPRKPARRETGSAAFAALAGLGSAPPRG